MTKQVNVTSLPAESGWSAPNNWTLNGGTEKNKQNQPRVIIYSTNDSMVHIEETLIQLCDFPLDWKEK